MGLGPILFQPKLIEKIWGGRRLETSLGKRLPDGGKYGESWEVSAHPGDETPVVSPEEFKGKTIPELAKELKEDFLGCGWRVTAEVGFPLLYKFIDAEDVLSVQVHPDDEYAKRDNDNGKTECWVIIDARQDSLIYRGFKQGTDLDVFDRLLAEGRLEECLHGFTVSPGDVLFLPARTVHAIGKGILLAEIQQSSDLTYRVYDWNRLQDGKPRALHIEKAREVMDFDPPEKDKEEARLVSELPGGGRYEELVRCGEFVLDRLVCRSAEPVPVFGRKPGCFSILSVLGGGGKLAWQGGAAPIRTGESLILPASLEDVRVSSDGEVVLINAYLPD